MINWLIQPLHYAFMQRGMIAAILVGITCAVIGCYVVLKGMAFLGDALAHAILPGIAIAYLFGGNLIIGAMVAAIVVALGIGLFSRGGTIKEDTAIGILFAGALALGVALISSIRSYAVDLSHILFGNVLGVSSGNLWMIAILSAVILISIILLYRPMLVVSFDPIQAKTLRLPTELIRNILLIQLAVTIVLSLQTVGVGLVTAMLVTPAATSYLLTRKLSSMMIISALIGAFSSLIGLYVSYYLNIASGAAIVLVTTAFFIIIYFFAPRKGLIRKLITRKRDQHA
jgi:ABC-type Mn2+/Zn2+ transport system permease subunit